MREKLLNIGCGETTHAAWVNIDIVASAPGVHVHDVRQGLPYADLTFDACYCSHMLEHVTREQAGIVVREAYRVLRKGGIARFVVPDLERIARLYIRVLEDVVAGKHESEADYDWMVLELLDQAARSFPGGDMGKYLSQPDVPNKAFVSSRIGAEAERVRQRNQVPRRVRAWEKMKSERPSWFIHRLRTELAGFLVGILAGSTARKAYREGLFRQSGEVHRWMYDRFSLQKLLSEAGFTGIKVCRADESSIPHFHSYNLDMVDNTVKKPDSLYMEGVKP